MCRNCGALVGANDAVCSACGAPAGSAPAHRDAPDDYARPPRHIDTETVRFARAVLSRPATFTFVFLTANVFLFLLMEWWGGTEDFAVLRAFGAKYNRLIDAGEWWRLVTPVFIHIGWLHIFVNMYSLFVLGPYVERLYGSSRFVFFWIATGIAGQVASYFAASVGGRPGVVGSFLFRGGDGPQAGASGALFGLVGVLFVFGIKFRHELPEGFKRAFGIGMLPTILINLVIGYTLPFIDNAAHLGGFAAGALLAALFSYKRPGQTPRVALAWHAAQIAALALVVVGFGEVARHFDSPTRSLRYVEAVNAGQQAFHAARERADASGADEALRKLDAAPRLDEQTGPIIDGLKSLVGRARAFALLAAEARESERGREQSRQLEADFAEWERRADGWVKSEGGKFGIFLSDEPKPAGDGAQDGKAQDGKARDGDAEGGKAEGGKAEGEAGGAGGGGRR
jgi:membrane associated rhomboid family serine protease